MEDTFKYCNGQDILDLFTLTVFSGSILFDGADTPTIRSHFRQWVESAFRAEQQPQKNSSDVEVRVCPSARYNFCIQVDAAALHSVLHDAPAPPALDPTKKGWVKLINRSWIPLEEDPRARPNPNIYEPIEGVAERRLDGMSLPEYHNGVLLRQEGLNRWRTEYCRPPKFVGPPYDE